MKQALAGFKRLVIDASTRETAPLLQEWGISVLPSLVFVDAEGEVTRVLRGVQPAAAVVAVARQAAPGSR